MVQRFNELVRQQQADTVVEGIPGTGRALK
jgi:hypothetical protein